MSDLDPDRVTETRTTLEQPRPTTEVTRTVERSSGAAWWAVALVGVAVIAAVTYVITRSPGTDTNSAVAAATQQIQSQAASQQAQTAAAQAQSAADSARQASQSAAARSAAPPAPPPSGQSAPAQSGASPGGSSQSGDQGGPPQ